MSQGEPLAKQAINASQHFTEPPPRYSEASLVKRMEELGIGRPSTYAAILQVLQDRGYVRIDKKRLVPEDKGRVVVGFLESFFQRYVEYDFTANLEEQLDRVSNNEVEWKKVLEDFWIDFIGAVNEIKELRVTHVLDALNDLLAPHIFPPKGDGSDPRACPQCANGKLSIKLGRFQGRDARRHRSGKGARAARAAARRRPASGRRRDDRRRHRPLRPLREARQDLRQSRLE
jgi:DNA topoisomerase-1